MNNITKTVIGILLIIVVLLAITLIPIQSKRQVPTGIIDDVSFGMTKREIKELFGEPLSEERDSLTRSTSLVYAFEINGYHADAMFCFNNSIITKGLSSVSIRIDDVSNPNDMKDYFVNKAYDIYNQLDSFYQENQSDNRTVLGTDNGATGIYCCVEVKYDSLYVWCSDIK